MSEAPAVTPDWNMFSKMCVLGEGAYGTVYLVKCLKASMLQGNSRKILSAPTLAMRRRLMKGNMLGFNMQSSVEKQNKVRSLWLDQQYVIKEIDTANVPKQAALEAIQEVELLAQIDSHFIVGYIDSFIHDTKINIIMEYCQHGDLSKLIQK